MQVFLRGDLGGFVDGVEQDDRLLDGPGGARLPFHAWQKVGDQGGEVGVVFVASDFSDQDVVLGKERGAGRHIAQDECLHGSDVDEPNVAVDLAGASVVAFVVRVGARGAAPVVADGLGNEDQGSAGRGHPGVVAVHAGSLLSRCR